MKTCVQKFGLTIYWYPVCHNYIWAISIHMCAEVCEGMDAHIRVEHERVSLYIGHNRMGHDYIDYIGHNCMAITCMSSHICLCEHVCRHVCRHAWAIRRGDNTWPIPRHMLDHVDTSVDMVVDMCVDMGVVQ